MEIRKGVALVDQNGTEWWATTDPDDTGEFRCANAQGTGTGNVNVLVVKDQ